MLGSASTVRLPGLERWIGLPAARARCVGHFLAIAATLAAAKVLLATIGVAAFVAEQGAAGLPSFYLGFAPIAIVLSFGLSGVIDRTPRARLAQITFAVLLIGTAALRLLLAQGIPGVSFALLASATALEIIVDIVFWVVVAAYLDVFELKRATPLIYMALAVGGAAGGALARVGAAVLLPADLLLLLLPLAGLVIVQFGIVANHLREVPEDHPPEDRPNWSSELASGLGLVPLARVLKRYPLALLIALNALVVTLLYGLAEFLILRIYETRFRTEAELAEFLSLLFALMQIVEFGLLYTLTRVLMERAGPLVRNLAFPLTSLGSLVFLVLNPKLPAAILLHVNIEAACNALFLPVNNVNYAPLPLGLQGRARTLSEGIFYPIGLGLAGAVLWTANPDAGLFQAEFAALIFVALFLLLSTVAGLLFLPTLAANIGATVIRSGAATLAPPRRPPAAAPQVRAFLRSREAELRLLGLALARELAAPEVEDDLLALAARPEPAIRLALARLVVAAPEPWRETYLDRCMAEENAEAHKLALLVMLMRRAPLKPEQAPRVLDARDPAVQALGHVVLAGVRAQTRVEPLIRRLEVNSQLVDAIVAARRTDCAPLLLACLAGAGPEQQHRALVMLNAAGARPDTSGDVVRALARDRHPAVRAEATRFLGRMEPWEALVPELVAALDDPDRRVRRAAAEALCRRGDSAVALLRPRLSAVSAASADAVLALARTGSAVARRLLQGYLHDLQHDARRTAHLLRWSGACRDRERWAAVEICLYEHKAQMIDVLLAALAPELERRHPGGGLADTLKSADQRARAKAFEVIASASASRLAPGALTGLRCLLFGDEAARGRIGSAVTADGMALEQASNSMSPWVRRAAAQVAARAAPSAPILPPTSLAGASRGIAEGAWEIVMDDLDFERIVALKRTSLFRYVSFETLALVARALEARVYLAGEEVVEAGTRAQDLLLLEAGALAFMHPDDAQTVPAPACFGDVALAGERMHWPRIEASRDARVSFLSAGRFEELCHERPELAIALARCLARRMRETGRDRLGFTVGPDWPLELIGNEPGVG